MRSVAQADKSLHEVSCASLRTLNPKISVSSDQVYGRASAAGGSDLASELGTVYSGVWQNRFEFKWRRGRFEGPVRVDVRDLPAKVFVRFPLVILQEKETKVL